MTNADYMQDLRSLQLKTTVILLLVPIYQARNGKEK